MLVRSKKVKILRPFVYLFALAVSVVLVCCQSPRTSQDAVLLAAERWTLGPCSKVDSVNHVLTAGGLTFVSPIPKEVVAWEAKDVFNPAAIVKNGEINLLFRAEDLIGKNNGTSRVGLAISKDGFSDHVCFIEGMVPY